MECLAKALASDQPSAVVGAARELDRLLGLGADHGHHSTTTTPRYGRSRHA
jgi:hypothetical protein